VANRRWVRVTGSICAALIAVIGIASGPSVAGAAPTLAAPATGPGVAPYPVNLPVGPQADASSCPNPPQLSAPLPSGASISAPTLTPPGLGSLTVAGETYDATGTCEYTINLPSSTNTASSDSISITYVESDSDFYFPTGQAGAVTFTWSGQSCNTTAEIVTAYGLAVAEQELNSGGCNTDSSGVYGYAEAINTALQTASLTTEPAFHRYYQSYESGTIFYGQFQECMENPAGQHSSYVCAWNNFGPLF
jgi:hypothetical protein